MPVKSEKYLSRHCGVVVVVGSGAPVQREHVLGQLVDIHTPHSAERQKVAQPGQPSRASWHSPVIGT